MPGKFSELSGTCKIGSKDNGEVWKDVVGYKGYYKVSNHGRVKSLARIVTDYDPRWGNMRVRRIKERIRSLSGKPYLSVRLARDGKAKTREVHRLVLEAFIGPCPKDMEGCHRDGNCKNNHLSNLRWDTTKGNFEDNIANGTRMYGEKNPKAKLTVAQVIEIRKLWSTKKYRQRQLAEMFCIGQSAISSIVRGAKWKEGAMCS